MKLLLLIPLYVFLLAACSGRDVIEQEYQYVAENIENNPVLTHHLLSVDQHSLHYVANGDIKKPAMIIIHGTPGSWRQYSRYLLNNELLQSYYMIVIDRPGWGDSTLGDGLSIADFALQAKIIAALAQQLREKNNGQAIVLMGHSLGGSIAPRVAMDYPQLIDGVLLFAGTVDPELSSPRWFNYLGKAPFAKNVIGERLHLSNQEIFALQANVDAMKDRWHEMTARIIAVQGMKDGLVYPANSDYIEREFPQKNTTVIRLDDEGHLFPMTLRDEVVAWAKQLLVDIENR